MTTDNPCRPSIWRWGIIACLIAGCQSVPRSSLMSRSAINAIPAERWTLFHGAPARGGVVRAEGFHGPLKTVWSYTPSGTTNGFLDWGPVTDRDTVFTPNGLNRVVALHAATGAVKWDIALESNVFNVALTPSADRLIVTTAITARPSPTLFVLDARTGVVQWNNRVNGQQAIGGIESAPVVDGRSVYVAYLRYDGAGGVCAFNLERGTQQWCWTRPQHSAVSPLAMANGRLYVGFDDGEIVCLQAQSGRVLWSFQGEAVMATSAPVIVGGHVLLALGRTVVSLEAQSGRVVWTRSLEAPVEMCSPAVFDGMAYLGTRRGTLVALQMQDGALVWEQDLHEGALTTSPIVEMTSRTLWIGSATNTVLGVALPAGDVITRYRVSDQPGLGMWRSSPVIVGDRLFIGSTDKSFYALAPAS